MVAIDIGGTKMAAGLVDAAGDLYEHDHVPTPQLGPGRGDELFGVLTTLVDGVVTRGRAAGRAAPGLCGVGSGGPMTEGGEQVSPLNIVAWRGFPLRARLAEHLGLDTYVDNDAKALARAEGWRGAARGIDDYIGMVVSTGVGGGIVVDGHLLDGVAGNAGHIGHLNVEPEGRRCPCGSFGCLEAEASGSAIAAITGAPAAQAGPEVIERTGRLVGRAVADVAILLDLQLAVVAGSVALGFGAPFFAAAQAEIERRARIEYARGCRIVPAGLGADGPLVGAAAVGLAGLDTGRGRSASPTAGSFGPTARQ